LIHHFGHLIIGAQRYKKTRSICDERESILG